jgi:hypothetical protein
MELNDPIISVNLTRSQWELVVGLLEDKSMKIYSKINSGLRYEELVRMKSMATEMDAISSDISDAIE